MTFFSVFVVDNKKCLLVAFFRTGPKCNLYWIYHLRIYKIQLSDFHQIIKLLYWLNFLIYIFFKYLSGAYTSIANDN
jgi:hypothetical protein